MKNFLVLIIAAAAFFVASCVGEYDNIEKYAGEIVYPAAFDTIIAYVGYERVELDLWKAGRLSASKMKLGKAKRTIVEYDEQMFPIDTICSWVNVTGLDQSKMYRIKVYTEDEYGNYSVPQSIAIIPYTSKERDLIEFAPPRLSTSPSSMVAEWSLNTLNSVLMDYHGMSWSYKDADGQTQSGSTKGTRFFASNFTVSSNASVEVTYKVVPRLSDADGTRILDTVFVTRTIEAQLPSATTPFTPAELNVLRANGITNFTPASVASVTSLTYPLHTSSFQDLFYFPSLTTLDLTGDGLQNILPVLGYGGNSMSSAVGGGAWQPFMRRVDKENDINIASVSTLSDLLESGQLTHVRYIQGTMGLDELFEPYIASGVVELVGNSDPLFPEYVFIEPQFFANGLVQDWNWFMENYYSGDFLPRAGYTDIGKFDPLNEVVNGDHIDLKLGQLLQSDGKNIYKCVIINTSASFFFALPKEFMFDSRQYRYLKYKMFCGTRAEFMDGIHSNFLRPWFRCMNHLWAFGSNSIYGNEDWDIRAENIPNDAIRDRWIEYTFDMNNNNWWGGNRETTDNGDGNRRNRVIIMNIGGEPWVDNDVLRDRRDRGEEAVIYIADVRLCKTQ